MKRITIDGVEYEPVQRAPGNRYAVIIDRGWIVIGDVDETSNAGKLTLHRPINLVRWGSGHLGGALADPDANDVVTATLQGPVLVPASAELFRVPVGDSWGL